jgi:H+-transporting ATPase
VDDPLDLAVQTANGRTSIVTVVVVWAYSIGVTIVIALVYYVLNKIPSLNNLGRQTRSRTDTQVENIIGQLSKLALEHEKDAEGRDRYVIATRATVAEDD